MKSPKLSAFAGLAVLTFISPILLVAQADDLEERVDWLLNKGWELYGQNSYVVSEIMLQNALARAEDLGDDHPKHAMVHYALGRVLEAQEKFGDAETQYLESTYVWARVQAPTVELIEPVDGLGRIFLKQEQYKKAEKYFQLAVQFWEGAAPGTFHTEKAGAIGNLGHLYFVQERYKKARHLLAKALDLESKAKDSVLFEVAFRTHDLAVLYDTIQKYEDAEPLYIKAIETLEKSKWEDTEDLAVFIENYASLLRSMGREQEAEKWETRAAGIRASQENKPEPDV